jgi:hypothetical protein
MVKYFHSLKADLKFIYRKISVNDENHDYDDYDDDDVVAVS